METAQEKIVPPSNQAGIPEEIQAELNTWLFKTKARRREIESLIGKLQFIAKCVKPGRIFLGRLIQWIRGMDSATYHPIPPEARKDIAWWARC